jgi:hypothetical protein
MAQDIQLTTFQTIKLAFAQLCEDARYTESDMGAHNPDPDYLAYLAETLIAIAAAPDMESLCAIHWISAKACLATDHMGVAP